MPDDRLRISREEIGLLLSYATRPDRLTEEAVDRLVAGVTGEELTEIVEWVGLPESMAVRLADANRSTAERTRRGLGPDPRFRRALFGIVVFMSLGNTALLVASDAGPFALVFGIAATALGGFLVYRLVFAISGT